MKTNSLKSLKTIICLLSGLSKCNYALLERTYHPLKINYSNERKTAKSEVKLQQVKKISLSKTDFFYLINFLSIQFKKHFEKSHAF